MKTQNRYGRLSHEASEVSAPKNNTKIKLPTPITITDQCNKVDEHLLPLNVPYRKKIVSVGIKLFVDNADDKSAIEKKLIEKKVCFYTHAEMKQRILKATLSGLPDVNIDEIKSDIIEKHEIEPLKIIKIAKRDNNILYIIHFNREQISMAELKNIKVVYNHIIRWLPYRTKRNGPTQCYKCLMYGHGASSCHRTQKCILCSLPHNTAECPTHRVDNGSQPKSLTFKCFNCAAHNLPHLHKATDPKCPFRDRYIEIRANITKRNYNNKRNTQQLIFSPAPPPPPLAHSFASVIKPNTRNPTPLQSDTTPAPSTENDLWSFAEVTQILMQSIEQLSNCKNKFDQLNVIASLLQHAVGK